ncbi:CRISPR-associated helicase Cas3' [uncultured Sulfitobacter sp.]|uniref:CRISPR-associated helicase Cas3' n=1 Tax=uncultured Sulfitobacter sp. TaxID=191468 RepID=UPI00259AE8BB|nr:CRISPR-associated helicase Cas3' [uncultured Sulfitobacter sp.]
MHPWGKTDLQLEAFHHLAHHSADVAATVVALLDLPTFRTKANRATAQALTQEQISCVGALAFLHDIGKLAPAFQIRSLSPPPPRKARDHLRCGWKWLMLDDDPSQILGGNAPLIVGWEGIETWFKVLYGHHGRPVPCPNESWGQDAFAPLPGYDWKAGEALMGQAMLSWFPNIRSHAPPLPVPAFAHFFAGLLALADWIGSDRTAFPFVATFDPDYWAKARKRANKRLKEIGLDTDDCALAGPASWPLLSDHPKARPAQDVVAKVPLTEQLVILEAETGAGKTEAALWRFAQLYEVGAVDSLYFAVPTRAAARQLQTRINTALARMFKPPAPEAVLAIPGQAISGEAHGIRLPEFAVKWDDNIGAEGRAKRWAAEHATRFLAAQIAVGTVDQIMMAGLMVKHAHLRGSALSRSLLVIDEVHASDAWMTEIQRAVLRDHLALGGHALLMSATLGAVARSAWRGTDLPTLKEAEATPYPAVWTKDACFPVPSASAGQKAVSISAVSGWSGEDAAAKALAAAQRGARVLVIRNTVDRARETFAACASDAPDMVFQLDDVPTLHHSRFAAEDRSRLDVRVEEVLCKDSPAQGVIVIGTQTLEQSLDIDADILITDLCPMDVLLQRIGRLHRHSRPRPDGFERASTLVLCPATGLDRLTTEPENGLGTYGQNTVLTGVYLDVPGLAATLHEIETSPLWRIPQMNRQLVERATHPERLDEIAVAWGWEEYRRRVIGKTIAETMGAENVILDRRAPFPDAFPQDEVIRTRLGESGVLVTLPEDTMGPFGHEIRTIALPAHWSRDLTGEEPVEILTSEPLTFRVGTLELIYDASGLTRLEDTTHD